MSSDSRPRLLRVASSRSNISRASTVLPMRASASMYQKVQMVKAVRGVPKSSGVA